MKFLLALLLLVSSFLANAQIDSTSKSSCSIKIAPRLSYSIQPNTNPYVGWEKSFYVSANISRRFELTGGLKFKSFKYYSDPYHLPVDPYLPHISSEDQTVDFYHEKFLSFPFILGFNNRSEKFSFVGGIGLEACLPYFTVGDRVSRELIKPRGFSYSNRISNRANSNALVSRVRLNYKHLIFGSTNFGFAINKGQFSFKVTADAEFSINRQAYGIGFWFVFHAS